MQSLTILQSRLRKHQTILLSQFYILTISKLKVINKNDDKSFHRLLLILSSDINLRPGPVYNHHPSNMKGWDIYETYETKGLHSLLSKIDELR